APNLGRTYHLIATACRDGHVRIYKLTPKPPPGHLFGGDEAAPAARHPGHRFVVTLVADLSDHAAEVWQVRWNVTGTILASAGDDGTVRNWKAASGGSGGWRCLSIINAE
ncbi:hypothetical protein CAUPRSCDRAFT_1808, partial [Caulochytrium protostelioides]